jgi:Tol biopolymer transport system component
MGRTGEGVRRLTSKGYYPAWSADGHQIIFCTEGPLPENRSEFSELWIVDTSGGEPHLFFQGDAVQPRVSPHGKRVAFWSVPSDPVTRQIGSSGVNRDIWTVDMKGGHAVRVTTHEANDWNPVWSPDGAWLYFLSNRSGSMNLWRVAIDETSGTIRGEPQALTAPSPYVADFSLSADGQTAAYASILSTTNIGHIQFDPTSGTVKGTPEAVTSGTNDFAYYDVTSDARFVVASTSSRTREDLYVISTSDGAVRQLTNDFARDRAPRWSPDGRHIFFYSDRTGDFAIFTIDADGGGLRQLTKGPARFYPVPSREGAHLAANDLNTRELYIYDPSDFSKPPETLPRFPETAPNTYPATADWSPDGRQIAISITGSGAGVFGVGGVWIYSLDTRMYRRLANGAGPVWLSDGRRIVYSTLGRLSLLDSVSNSSHELLALPDEAVLGGRLSADNTQLFFVRAKTSGDIWLMRFPQANSR